MNEVITLRKDQKWEYRFVVKTERRIEDINSFLSAYGNGGWELVNFQTLTKNDAPMETHFYFKRPFRKRNPLDLND